MGKFYSIFLTLQVRYILYFPNVAGLSTSMSVDLSSTSLCEIPDALLYLGHYMCGPGNQDYVMPDPAMNKSMKHPMEGVPDSPCS